MKAKFIHRVPADIIKLFIGDHGHTSVLILRIDPCLDSRDQIRMLIDHCISGYVIVSVDPMRNPGKTGCIGNHDLGRNRDKV